MTSPASGLRLSYLRHFINEHGGETSFAGKTTAQVCFEYVVPLTKPTELSLVDHVANDPTTALFVAPANWYVSHAWQYLFLETVDSLERFFADRNLADDAVIWFCVVNNNQHLAATQSFASWSTTFKDSLATIGNMVMIMHPWNDPIVLRRSWCVFEVYVAVTMGARFEIALARDQEATFLNDIAEDGAFLKMLATIKSEDSETTVPSDRDGIFDLIRAETSFVAVDRLIFSTLSNWIKTTLEASIASTASLEQKAMRWRHLGRIYGLDDKHDERERCARRAVDAFTLVYGPHHVTTLQAQGFLAMSIASQRRPTAEWAPLFAATLAALEVHGGATCDDALSHDIHGALREHLALFDLERHKLGLFNARTAATMSCIGRDYNQLFMPRVAARWLQKALAVEDALFGTDHHATMSTILSLAGALAQQGKVAEALAWTKRLVTTSDRTLGPENSTTIVSKANAAILELMAGHARDAMVQLRSLEALLADRPTIVDFLAHVQEALGLAYWADGNLDAAATAFAQALTTLPSKQMAWTFFRFCASVPSTTLDSWDRVLCYIESTDDPEPETWPASCLRCFKPIVGGFVTCASCPNGLLPFCATCAADHATHVGTLSTGSARAFQGRTTPPPRRFFLQEKVVAMGKANAASFAELDAAYCEYDAYCDAHNVPRLERLPRTAVEGLNRDWHPML